MLKRSVLSALACALGLALAPRPSDAQTSGPPPPSRSTTTSATPTSIPPVTPTPVSSPLDPVTAAARQLLKAINLDRARRHVLPLVLDKQQSKCSLKHSERMAALGMASHVGFPADICAPNAGAAAENVGYALGQSSAESAVLMLHQAMMAEGPCPHATCTGLQFEQHGHYLNLTSPLYTRVGIGILIRNGGIWLTEDFLSVVPNQSSRPIPRTPTTHVQRSGRSSARAAAHSI